MGKFASDEIRARSGDDAEGSRVFRGPNRTRDGSRGRAGARGTARRTHRFCFPSSDASTIRDCSTTLAHFTNHSDTICAALFAIAAGPFRGGCQSAPRPLVESAPPRGVEGRLALPSGSRRPTRASRGRRDSPRRAAVLPRILRPRRPRRAAPRMARAPRKTVCLNFPGNSPFDVARIMIKVRDLAVRRFCVFGPTVSLSWVT